MNLQTKMAELSEHLKRRTEYEQSIEVIRPGCLYKNRNGEIMLVIKVDNDSLISALVQTQPCSGCLLLPPESTGLNYPIYATKNTDRQAITKNLQLQLLARIYDPLVYKSAMEHYKWSLIKDDLRSAWLGIAEGIRNSIELYTAGQACPMPCGPVLPSLSFCSGKENVILEGFSRKQLNESAKVRLWIIKENNTTNYLGEFDYQITERGIPIENVALRPSDHLAWIATVARKEVVHGLLWVAHNPDDCNIPDLILKGFYQRLLLEVVQLAQLNQDVDRLYHNFAIYFLNRAQEHLHILDNCSGIDSRKINELKVGLQEKFDDNKKIIDAYFSNIK
jgi:hypothetical protein